MDCLHYKEIISAHVDGTLAAEEELEVQSHLDQCPKCKQFFRWETDVKKLLRQKFSPIVVQPSFKAALLEQLEGKRKRTSVRWSYKKEGIVAGLIGAATIAVWFLLLDALNGRPLHTPTVLGTALFRHGTGLDAPDSLSTSAEMVLMYTWVHALVFCVIGVVASKLIALVERVPEIGFGSFLFFSLDLSSVLLSLQNQCFTSSLGTTSWGRICWRRGRWQLTSGGVIRSWSSNRRSPTPYQSHGKHGSRCYDRIFLPSSRVRKNVKGAG